MVSKAKEIKWSDVDIQKSPGDLNEYMYFTLPNKVQVLLI